MNSKEKREEIVALINNIKEHSDRLTHMPHMPLLEVSAILSKINRLHESTVVLKYLLAKEQHHEDEEFGLRISRLKMLEEEELDEDDNSTENDLEEDIESIHDYDDEEDQDDNLDVDEEKLDLKEEFNGSATSTQTASSTATQTVIEEMEDESGLSSKSDINEQYAEEQEDRSLSEQLKKQPIADLMAAIGLNERYLYANDLFGGDIEEFRKVIRTLNDLDNEEKAISYFNVELRKTYGWEEENELAEALLILVRRRFQD